MLWHILSIVYTIVKKWYAEFKCGRASNDDAERSGRPNKSVTKENIKKVHRIVLHDRKIKVNEIADMVQISTDRVRHILYEHLGMKKLIARWVTEFSNN